LAKLRYWLISITMLGLVLCLAYSPGWATTDYFGLAAESITAKPNGTEVVSVPLQFTISGVKHFTLSVVYDPDYLTLPENGVAQIINDLSGHDWLAAARQVDRSDGGPSNEVMISACVGSNGTALNLSPVVAGQAFLTLHFSPNTAKGLVRDGASTKVHIEGFAGKDQVQELSTAETVINFIESPCTISVKVNAPGGKTDLPHTVRLWGPGVEYKQDLNSFAANPETVTFQPVKKGNDYWVTVESAGYGGDLVRISIPKTSADTYTYPKPLSLSQIPGRIALVRKITLGKKLELNFAYKNYLGIIEDWPSGNNNSATLVLAFSRKGGRGGTESVVSFDPKTGSPAGGPFVVSPMLVDPAAPGGGTVFTKKYISMTIDPNTYCTSNELKTDTNSMRYHLSFTVSSSTRSDIQVSTNTIDVDIPRTPDTSLDMTKVSIAQAGNTFKGDEIKSAGVIPIKADFYLDNLNTESSKKEIEATFTAADMSLNYLKINPAGGLGSYLDPNKIAGKTFNLAVELKPCATDPNATVIRINFTDENGNSLEYDPPETVRATAGPLVFDIPLHKNIQNEYGPRAAHEDPNILAEEIVRDRLITQESQDASLPENAGRYGIYFQGVGEKPRIFIPNGSQGESITVLHKNGLFFAEITSKHSSAWLTATSVDAQKVPPLEALSTGTQINSSTSHHSDNDHWYECFIESIRPRFISK